MTDEQIERVADFYGITLEEGRRRYEIVQAQKDDPNDPICIGCAKRPDELPEYLPYRIDDEPMKNVVKREEDTFNIENGHFLCNECYIKNGMPSSKYGWVCP